MPVVAATVSPRERWERAVEGPLAIAALAFLVAYAVPIIWPATSTGWRQVCQTTVTVVWALFIVDYAVRFALSSDRRRFVATNLVDLAVIALPVLRPLRLLRLVAVLAILNRTSARTLRGRVVTYVVGGTLLLLLVGGLAVTDAERGVGGATIHGFGDGLWWAVTTMTTVGYGDRYPVTTTGRFVAVALMVGGIALLGVVTATLASWLVDRVAAESKAEQAATRAQVESLARQVEQLQERLAAWSPGGPSPT
ncbi:MAG: potassium channel family protein [Actinobacteria bacterium]|nr:potassium channel family protein [Actinomycetota bacterium]MCG2800502.1 potassium channel family protein [Cellulomonas sp.]